MSLKVWLIFFIISMAFSAEVLVWAMQHGQFRNVNRGRWMPLRHPPSSTSASRTQPWSVGLYFVAIAAVSFAVGRSIYYVIASSFQH